MRRNRPPYILLEKPLTPDARGKIYVLNRLDYVNGDLRRASMEVTNTLKVAIRLESYDWCMDAKKLFKVLEKDDKQFEKKRLKTYIKMKKKIAQREGVADGKS